MVKNTKKSYTSLEKVFAIAGTALVLFGFAANLFSAYINQRFILEPIDALYYFRYCLLLGGGFLIGYLMSLRAKGVYNKLFVASAYAFLAMAIFWATDFMRVILQNLGFPATYPWGKFIFEGMSLLALVITIIVALIVKLATPKVSLGKLPKGLFVSAFLAAETYLFLSPFYYLITDKGTLSLSTPFEWLLLAFGYIINPLVVTAVSYWLLSGVKKKLARLFYATFIGSFISYFNVLAYELRTDASAETWFIYAMVVFVIAICITTTLLWQSRKALK